MRLVSKVLPLLSQYIQLFYTFSKVLKYTLLVAHDEASFEAVGDDIANTSSKVEPCGFLSFRDTQRGESHLYTCTTVLPGIFIS